VGYHPGGHSAQTRVRVQRGLRRGALLRNQRKEIGGSAGTRDGRDGAPVAELRVRAGTSEDRCRRHDSRNASD
jgi:hypothetical protein